jgi:hypothetical protein
LLAPCRFSLFNAASRTGEGTFTHA